MNWFEIDGDLWSPHTIRVFNYPGCNDPYVSLIGDNWIIEVRNKNLTVNEIKEYIYNEIVRNDPIITFPDEEEWITKFTRAEVE